MQIKATKCFLKLSVISPILQSYQTLVLTPCLHIPSPLLCSDEPCFNHGIICYFLLKMFGGCFVGSPTYCPLLET